MTRKTIYSFPILAFAFHLFGCTLDDPGPSQDFTPGNAEPCRHYQYPTSFFEPKNQEPEYIDQELSLNPNNPNQMVGVRYYSDRTNDSIFLFDLTHQTQPQLIKTGAFHSYGLKWGAKDWVIFQGSGLQMMKSNGDSLRFITWDEYSWLSPSGWNPQGDRFFCTDAWNTWIYDLNGVIVDSIVDFVAYNWFSRDSILGTDYSLGRDHPGLSLFLPQDSSMHYQMPFPVSDNTLSTWDLYYPHKEIQMHRDHDHFSILAGNSLWIASLKAKSAKEIMYFCFARTISGIHYQPHSDRLLVEERRATQLPNLAAVFENYLVALNPHTAFRLDTLWAFRP